MYPAHPHPTRIPARPRPTAGRSRRPRPGALLLLRIGIGAATVAAVMASCAPAPPPPRVVVYGDSLAAEAMDRLRGRVLEEAPGHVVLERAMGGTATCDWLPHMLEDVTLEPALVVVAFTGNRLTGCIRDRDPVEGYRADTARVVEFWSDHDVDVLVVGTPGRVGVARDDRPEVLAAMEAADETGSPVVDLADRFIDDTGHYAEHLPCLPGEGSQQGCDAGMIRVRAGATPHGYDGAHLCGERCDEYSSGVVRYAEGVVTAVAAALGTGPPTGDQGTSISSRTDR